jgi:Fe-S-cluster containining protein
MDMDKLYNPQYLSQLAKNSQQANAKFLKKLKSKKPRRLDDVFAGLHHQVFEQVDCLKCANCCRNLGPRISHKDLERLAKFLRMKPLDFIAQYLRIDEDNDYVFQSMPCPFLADDNYCMVYESRPKACREYPHTDSKKMVTLLNLALKNTETCPAVFLVVEELKMLPPEQLK